MVISKDLYDVIDKTLFFKETGNSENNNEYCTYLHHVYSIHRNNSSGQQIGKDDKKRQNQSTSSFNILFIDDGYC